MKIKGKSIPSSNIPFLLSCFDHPQGWGEQGNVCSRISVMEETIQASSVMICGIAIKKQKERFEKMTIRSVMNIEETTTSVKEVTEIWILTRMRANMEQLR